MIMEKVVFLVIVALLGMAHAASHFAVEDQMIGDLHTKVLKNTKTDEYVQIITDLGGRVEDLVLMHKRHKKLRSVLLTHNKNATEIKENAWWKNAILLPYANRINGGKYTFYNGSYQLPINDVTNNNAMHGFLENKTMKVEDQSIDSDAVYLKLSYQFDGKDLGYPFHPYVQLIYMLSDEGFDIHIEVTNMDLTEPMLFYVGWHPYFKCPVYKSVITFDRQCNKWAHVLLNNHAIPTGVTESFTGFNGGTVIGGTLSKPTHYDDAYKAIGNPNDIKCSPAVLKTTLYDPDADETIALYQDNFPIVQVFTGIVGATGEQAVAIEPMSAMTDSFNNHDNLEILSGGETWTGIFGVHIE
ncbi:uncharacterized protein YihR-like [Dysidea avara]|uniref:uncharacterized protein YihR-like n=1 Tax=Dysidea avara TaxID=196820 RepID=UPI003325B927